MQMAGQALGAPMQIAGAFMGAESAKRRKKKLEEIAQTPGMDFSAAAGDAVAAGNANLPGAQKFATGVNLGAQGDLTAVLEKAIPGYSPMQASRSQAVQSFLKGEIPADVAQQINRAGASHALEGGYGGTPAGRNLVARDLGLTSLNLMDKGLNQAGNLIQSTPLPRMMQANDILNLTASGVGSTRSKERTEKLDMLLGAAQAPTSSDVWAKTLTDMGGQMASSGGGGGGGGMGGLGGIMGLIGMI